MHQVVGRGGSRWLLLLVLVAAGVFGLMIEGSRSSATTGGDPQSPVVRSKLDAALAGAKPVAALSTQTSRTYRRADGTFVTRVFAQNAAVDPSLSKVPEGYAAEGNGSAALFPASMTDPVKIRQGRSWVSMKLRGAAGSGDPDGPTITYKNALAGVDVKYRASAGAIGEELHLRSTDAPARYTFDLRASTGVQAKKQRNGTIALTDPNGKKVFGLAPSYAFANRDRDATQRVTTVLTETDGGWRITLSVDEVWLRRELALGPVTIDPTVELQGASKDCALTSDTPDLSFCADDQLWIGWNGDHDHHSLIKWDLSAIPTDAVTLWGDAALYQPGAFGIPVSKDLTLHRLTRDWTNGASWNTYDGTNPWTTPGGDFDPSPAATATVPANHAGWTEWSVTSLVQHWVDGSLPNYGVAIQDKPGPHVAGEEDYLSTEGTGATQAPELDIVWTPRTGDPEFYTFERQNLDAKTAAGVNAANGNLLLSTNDIAASGNGLDLKLDHYHNSIADPGEVSALGIRGTASLGRDVHLHAFDNQTIGFSRGDGVTLPFIGAETSGTTVTWGTPPELGSATLSKNTTTGKYTLRLPAGLPSYPGVDLTLTFDSPGKLLELEDATGHRIALNYYPQGAAEFPALGGITDANNAYWDVDAGYFSDDRIADILDPAGRHTLFGYVNTSGDYLDTVTTADETVSRYTYDSSNRLKSITTADGNVTLVTYTGSSSKVASVVRTTDAAHTTGPTTTFTYSSPTSPCQPTDFDYTKTVVNRPDNTSTTYCANNHAQITYDTDDPTSVTPSGEWYDLRDRYTKASGNYAVTLAGADLGAGVKKVALEQVGGADIASKTLSCDPRNALNPIACPHKSAAELTFDAGSLAEGARTFRGSVTDYAGNVKRSVEWVVKVDRTAPTVPSEPDLADYDEQTQTAIVTFTGGDDPALADGQPGSGVGRSEIRYRIGAGAWTDWTTTVDDQAVITGVSIGSTISIELRTIDAVGNASGVSTGSVLAEVSDADFVDFPINAAAGADAAIEVVLHLPEGDAVPVGGLPVTVEDGNGQHATVRTNGEGVAHFSGLAAGNHIAYASQAPGTEEVSDQQLFITPGTVTSHRIDLRLQGRDYGEGVSTRGLPDYDSDGVQEVKDCISNFPLKVCYQWLGDALRAESVASTLFGVLGVVPDSTRANAFKHSYAVSLFVRTMLTKFKDDGPAHWGYDYARLHELKDRVSPNIGRRRASFMDTNNNLVALNYTTDHPTRNMAQLCSAMRSKAKNSRYVKFPSGADHVDVRPNHLRTQLIHIQAYDPDVDGSGNPVDPGVFPQFKPCKYALHRYVSW